MLPYYYSVSEYLKDTYGKKLYKLSLSGNMTCPNRDGFLDTRGCIFCSGHGSGDFAVKDIDKAKTLVSNKYSGSEYIAYFQSFTNTYADAQYLRELFMPVILRDDIRILSIATRPDCLGDDVLDLLEEMSKKVYLWVELGLQTINDETAENFNRGYKFEVFKEGIKKLQDRGIEVVVHSIFGLPGETKEDMLKTIDYIAHSGAQGIKFHLLHLMKYTKMAEQYYNGEFELLSEEDYIDLICQGISMIPEEMVVHRLTGDAPRATLIGPMWSLKKWEVLNAIDKALVDRDIWQGKNFK